MLTFDRTDITQTAQAERGTMEVLPLSKGKRQNKIVLGDADGVVQALGMRKGEDTRSSVFKTRLSSDPIASLTLGAGKGQEDKIFVASGATVRGVNKKGKEFFKFSTNLTERIEDVRVDGVDMWATGEYFSNQFSDCADAHFFASNERIADARVAPVVLASEKNPILACRDRFVRVVQGSELYYEAAVAGAASALHVCERNDARRREHRDEAARETVDHRAPKPHTREKLALPPDFEHASRREALFGTEQGLCGQLFLDGERVARGWVIDTNASRRAGAGGVSAIHAECDLTGDGRADVVIGRDDGSIETYAFDENGEPALAGRVDCGEAVQTLRHGRVTTPFPEILAHTFSGKVISFKPGADSTSADGFGMGEALDDAQAAARRFAEKRRVDDVRLETERLAAETQVARAKYAELSGDLIAADGPSRVLDRFRLDAETATHRLTLEAPAAIESVAVHVSSARVDLLDEYGAGAEAFFSSEDTKKGAGTSAPRSAASGNATAAIVSRTPPELCQKVHGAPGALAVYRLPSENQTRFEIEMRCQEGAPGAIRACVIPLRPPKTVREVVREVKPLCLHRRVLTETLVSESDGAKSASSEDALRSLVLGAGRVAEALTATGDFLAEDAHQWVAELLDDVPNTLAGDSFSYDFENALLGTRLRVAGSAGEASFWSDGATPLALIKAHVGKRAAKSNLRVRFAFAGDDATPATFARRVHPLIAETIRLARSSTLLEGLRELKMQEPELDRFLSPEYAAVLAEEKSVDAEARARRGRLAYLVGVVKDFFVDWHAFRGENVKKDMHEVDAVFSQYALEKMVETLERRAHP